MLRLPLYPTRGFSRPAAPCSSGKIYTPLANLTSMSAGAISREIGFVISVPFHLRSLLSGLAVAPNSKPVIFTCTL